MGGNSGENEHFENPVEDMNITFRKALFFFIPRCCGKRRMFLLGQGKVVDRSEAETGERTEPYLTRNSEGRQDITQAGV